MSLQAPTKRRFAVELLALAALLLVLAVAARYALDRPVFFDGAMNLQVAQSLADGHGYARDYGGVRPFPAEVQTNAPFVVPAAAVFAVAGVGLWQSQLTNYGYLLALLGLVVALGWRHAGRLAGLLAALSVVLVPGFFWIGMNGWGEIPALFWWAAGTWLLLADASPRWAPWGRALGGVCLGLAISTKTVLLIGLGATALVYGLWVLRDHWTQPRVLFRRALVVMACIALPLLAVELWRFASFGTADYLAWWRTQLGAIVSQTGVMEAHHVASQPKLVRHFDSLARQTAVPRFLLACWLLVPIAGAVAALARNPVASERNRLWTAIALVAGVYFAWWLMVTPDTHVRLRRIEIGLILGQCLWLFHLARWVTIRRGSALRRAAGGVSIAVFAVACLYFALAARADMRKRWGADMDDFNRIVAVVHALPRDSALFGKGFLSAPVLGLYADRRVQDIDRYSAGQLAALGSGYILIDSPARQDRRFAPELRRYPHELVADAAGFQVYRLDFTRKLRPFSGRDLRRNPARDDIDFRVTPRYPLVFGLLPPSQGGRWARTDAEIMLRYDGGSVLSLLAYKPPKPYLRPGPLTVTARVDGCLLGSRVLPEGRHALEFPVAPPCRPKPGSIASVQLDADNLLAEYALDLRQHSYVLSGIGFGD